MNKHENHRISRHKEAKHLHPHADISQQEDRAEKDTHPHGSDVHDHGEGHEHEHGGIFGKNTELIFAILCGSALGAGWGLHFVKTLPEWISLTCYIVAYFFGGYFTAKEAVETIMKGGFEIDFLTLVAAVGAAILGS